MEGTETVQQSLGKKLGTIAFYISEIIAICFLIAIIIDYIINKKIDLNNFNSLLLYQGSIITVTWGAKASSNFAPKKHHEDLIPITKVEIK